MDDDSRLELVKWIEEIKRRDAERAHDLHYAFRDKLNDAALNSGTTALRTGVLINGGAAVAVLAFIGGLVGQGKLHTDQIGPLTSTLIWFALGVATSAAGLAFAYFTNYFAVSTQFSRKLTWENPFIRDATNTKRLGWVSNIFQVLAVIAGVSSLVLFILGMFDVRGAITNLHTS